MTDTDALVERAGQLLDLRSVGDARKLLRRAVALDPEHVGARCELARAHLAEGRYDEAEEAAGAALARQPDHAYAAYLRASALVSAEHPDAVPAAELAVRLDEDFWPAYGKLAGALLLAGEPVRAVEVAGEGARRAPSDPSAHAMLAGIADEAKQFELAEREYTEALRLDPDHTRARLGLAAVDFGRRRVRRGGEHLVAAASQDRPPKEAVEGLRHLVNLGSVIALSGVGASALIAVVALAASAFGAGPTQWARLLSGSMAALMLALLIYLRTRLPHSALSAKRSGAENSTDNSTIAAAASAASIALLSAFAATGLTPFLVLEVLIALPAFLTIDLSEPDPAER